MCFWPMVGWTQCLVSWAVWIDWKIKQFKKTVWSATASLWRMRLASLCPKWIVATNRIFKHSVYFEAYRRQVLKEGCDLASNITVSNLSLSVLLKGWPLFLLAVAEQGEWSTRVYGNPGQKTSHKIFTKPFKMTLLFCFIFIFNSS